jgi:hypothetical protein
VKPLRKKPNKHSLEKIIIIEIMKVTEVEEAVVEEVDTKEAEEVDPKLLMRIVMIVHMLNANHFIKKRMLILKKMRILMKEMNKSRRMIRRVEIDRMKLMRTPFISDITMELDLNSIEFKSQLILKFLTLFPEKKD